MKTMTTDQLYLELNKRGHFPLFTITLDDVKNYFLRQDIVLSDEMAFKACHFLNKNWSDGEEMDTALHWINEQIEENTL